MYTKTGTDRFMSSKNYSVCLRAAQRLAPVAVEVHTDLGAWHEGAELLHGSRVRLQDIVDAVPSLSLQQPCTQLLLGPLVCLWCDPSKTGSGDMPWVLGFG